MFLVYDLYLAAQNECTRLIGSEKKLSHTLDYAVNASISRGSNSLALQPGFFFFFLPFSRKAKVTIIIKDLCTSQEDACDLLLLVEKGTGGSKQRRTRSFIPPQKWEILFLLLLRD